LCALVGKNKGLDTINARTTTKIIHCCYLLLLAEVCTTWTLLVFKHQQEKLKTAQIPPREHSQPVDEFFPCI